MNHTKEPWEVIAVDNMYEIHSKTAGHEVVWSIDSIANAQRIVACVNACDDLTNKHLNDGVIYRLIALQGLVHTLSFGSDWNKGTHATIVRDEIIKISNEIHKILVDGEDV